MTSSIGDGSFSEVSKKLRWNRHPLYYCPDLRFSLPLFTFFNGKIAFFLPPRLLHKKFLEGVSYFYIRHLCSNSTQIRFNFVAEEFHNLFFFPFCLVTPDAQRADRVKNTFTFFLILRNALRVDRVENSVQYLFFRHPRIFFFIVVTNGNEKIN